MINNVMQKINGFINFFLGFNVFNIILLLISGFIFCNTVFYIIPGKSLYFFQYVLCSIGMIYTSFMLRSLLLNISNNNNFVEIFVDFMIASNIMHCATIIFSYMNSIELYGIICKIMKKSFVQSFIFFLLFILEFYMFYILNNKTNVKKYKKWMTIFVICSIPCFFIYFLSNLIEAYNIIYLNF